MCSCARDHRTGVSPGNSVMPTRRAFLASTAAAAMMPASLLQAQTPPASGPKLAGEETRLFVDDYDILYRPGTKRVLQPLKRHPSNPLLRGGEKPWSRDIAYCSVYRDDRSGKYQLWYQSYAGSTAHDRTRRCT